MKVGETLNGSFTEEILNGKLHFLCSVFYFRGLNFRLHFSEVIIALIMTSGK